MGNLLKRSHKDPVEAVRAITDLPYVITNQTLGENGAADSSFSVLSYNILADCYKNVFLFTIPCQFLDFNYRSKVIVIISIFFYI